ncbi:MAG: hypothetical protein V1753_01265, partial [Pseudomonadota bacterium]
IQALACTEKGSASMIFAIASISILVFIRSAIFDILDIQGDRIVGQKTLPVALGEKRMIQILRGLLTLLIIAFPMGYWLGFVTSFAFGMVLCVLYLAGMIEILECNLMVRGFKFEFIVETSLVMSGLIAWGWYAYI